ncbi:MAG: hypothetical protein ABIV13_03950 [Fimbriimonadales bacterium]
MVIQERLAGMHSGRWSAGAPQPESFKGFEQVDSNREVCKQALAFVDGRVRNFVIHGARGWGKSHLTQSIANMVGLPVVDVREKSLRRLPDTTILLLDDADCCRNSPKKCQQIRLELERRVRGNRRTVVVLSGTERTVRSFLPSPRSWKTVRLGEPCDAERAAIVRRMCANEGLELSFTSMDLVARLVRGDGHSLTGALSRLKVGADGQAAVLHPLRVAGLLHPYLLDGCGYDIRDVILEQVARSTGGDARRHYELAVFALAEIAGLSEVCVADYFGMRPVDVYRVRTWGIQRRADDAIWRSQVDRIVYNTTSYLCEA